MVVLILGFSFLEDPASQEKTIAAEYPVSITNIHVC